MVRKCSVCGAPMDVGYCIHDGGEYYCSDECLHEVYTEEEYTALYNEDDAYWTMWTDETEESQAPASLRVCFKAPGCPVQDFYVNNDLSALQGLVGGYIETGRVIRPGVVVLCDEEGLLKQLPYNCLGLVGPLVFIGVGEEDFCSLTDEEVAYILEWEASSDAG